MKDIGIKLKEKREENGVSIEEASEDLKVRESQLVSLEEGNRDDFKDVVFLKYLIRDYAKYLGLDGEKLVDEFNEFLFDYTSKIPVEDIEKAKANGKIQKEFASPYTSEKKDNKGIKIIAIISGVLALFIIVYFILSSKLGNDFQDNDITYVIRR